MVFLFLGIHWDPVLFSAFSILFQDAIPKCHKIYPNCIWHVPPEWHSLKFDLALLTKVYRNYATQIVRVCVSSKSPINPNLYVTKKSNLQVHFGSKGMAGSYELLCHHSLTCSDPFLEEILFYHPTRFPSHVFDFIAHGSCDNQSNISIDSSVFAFYSDDSNYFSWIFFTLPFLFFVQPQDLSRQQALYITNGPLAENDRQPRRPEGLRAPGSPVVGKWLQLLPPLLSSPGGEQPEPLLALKTCQHVAACEVGPHFTIEGLPRRLIRFIFSLMAPAKH